MDHLSPDVPIRDIRAHQSLQLAGRRDLSAGGHNRCIQLLERPKAEGVRKVLHEPAQPEHAVVIIDESEVDREDRLVILNGVHYFSKL
jgi:hypothetical protein